MLAYCLDVTIEQFGQLLPVKPHRLLFQSHLQFHFAVRLIKYDFSLILHLALRLGAQRYGFYPQDCQKPGAFSPIIPFPSLSKSVLDLYLFHRIYKSGGYPYCSVPLLPMLSVERWMLCVPALSTVSVKVWTLPASNVIGVVMSHGVLIGSEVEITNFSI